MIFELFVGLSCFGSVHEIHRVGDNIDGDIRIVLLFFNKTAHKSLGGAERIPEDVEGPLFC
jgi:hypothetical protein